MMKTFKDILAEAKRKDIHVSELKTGDQLIGPSGDTHEFLSASRGPGRKMIETRAGHKYPTERDGTLPGWKKTGQNFAEDVDLDEAVVDVAQVKRKPLAQRTPREQAAIDAAKQSKPKAGKIEVHIKYDDGKVRKERFKLMKREKDWESEAQEVADSYLKNIQTMYDKNPELTAGKPRPKEIHKVEIK
jgi:hypothetical protein